MNLKNFFALLAFFTQGAFALTVTDQRGSIEVNLHKDWEYEQNILGLPHVFLTKDNPERTSLSLTLTGIKGVNLPVKDLQKNQEQYQSGRKAWAEKRDATVLKFIPYSASENSNKVKIHIIGMNYKMNGKDYLEKSFYAECPNSFVHLKLLTPNNSIRTQEAEEMVQALKCLN
jgi:hypothetical protein